LGREFSRGCGRESGFQDLNFFFIGDHPENLGDHLGFGRAQEFGHFLIGVCFRHRDYSPFRGRGEFSKSPILFDKGPRGISRPTVVLVLQPMEARRIKSYPKAIGFFGFLQRKIDPRRGNVLHYFL
jgi:hypothetical protein